MIYDHKSQLRLIQATMDARELSTDILVGNAPTYEQLLDRCSKLGAELFAYMDAQSTKRLQDELSPSTEFRDAISAALSLVWATHADPSYGLVPEKPSLEARAYARRPFAHLQVQAALARAIMGKRGANDASFWAKVSDAYEVVERETKGDYGKAVAVAAGFHLKEALEVDATVHAVVKAPNKTLAKDVKLKLPVRVWERKSNEVIITTVRPSEGELSESKKGIHINADLKPIIYTTIDGFSGQLLEEIPEQIVRLPAHLERLPLRVADPVAIKAYLKRKWHPKITSEIKQLAARFSGDIFKLPPKYLAMS